MMANDMIAIDGDGGGNDMISIVMSMVMVTGDR
jgi:hypothetical protein